MGYSDKMPIVTMINRSVSCPVIHTIGAIVPFKRRIRIASWQNNNAMNDVTDRMSLCIIVPVLE